IPIGGFLPAGVKPGLSNIITMYAVFFMGYGEAFSIAVLKSLFVLLTRGATAAFLSASGGLFSVLVMLLLLLPKRKLSYLSISVFGSVTHNLAQLAAVSLILGNDALFYAPVLVISGVAMGVVTGMLLRAVLPALGRLRNKF
ncbi:MAG: Gx transporter family protein, partial [Acetanaerobacterium sp.]